MNQANTLCPNLSHRLKRITVLPAKVSYAWWSAFGRRGR